MRAIISKLPEDGLDGPSKIIFLLAKSYLNFGRNDILFERGPGSTMHVTDIPIAAALV